MIFSGKNKKNNVRVEHHNLDWDKKIHQDKVFINPYKKHVEKGPTWRRSFHFPLYFGWELVFTLQKIADKTKQIVGPFKTYKAYITIVVLFIFIFSTVFLISNKTATEAATYTFTQTDWSTGITANNASHLTDQTGWGEYSAKDTNIDAGTEIVLTQTSSGLTETDDTAFNAGTTSDTTVSGTGAGTNIESSLITPSGFPSLTNEYMIQGVHDPDTNTMWFITTEDNLIQTSPSGEHIATYAPSSYFAPVLSGIIYDTTSDTIWIYDSGDRALLQIDTSDGSIINNIDTNPKIFNRILYDPISNSIWSVGSGSEIYKMPIATEVIQTITSANFVSPYDSAFDTTNNKVWVVDDSADKVIEFDALTASEGLSYSWTYGGAVRDAAYEPATHSLWLGNSSGAHKIALSDGTESSQNLGLSNAYNVAYDPATQSIWQSGLSSTQVAKIDVTDITSYEKWDYRVYESINGNGLVYDTTNGNMWVLGERGAIPLDSNGFNPYFTTIDVDVDFGGANVLPSGILYEPFTESMWLAAGISGCYNADRCIGKYNANTGNFISAYSGSVDTYTVDIGYDSVTQSVWLPNYNSSSITKINPSTGAVVNTYSTGGSRPWAVIFETSTNSLWISNRDAASVVKMDPTDGTILDTFTDADLTYPEHLVFDSGNNAIWVTSYTNDKVVKINAADATKVDSYTVTDPYDITYDPTTQSIWLANYRNITKLSASDGSTLQTWTNVHGVDTQRSIARDSDTGLMWASSFTGGYITAYNPSTETRIGSWSVGGNTTAESSLEYNPKTKEMWLMKYYDRLNSSTEKAITRIPTSIFASTGTFESQILNPSSLSYDTITWNETLPGSTSITMKARSDSDPGMAGATAWASCNTVTNGQDLTTNNCVDDADAYIQYQATLNSDPSDTAQLHDVTLNYNHYPSSQTLTSSAYNATDAANAFTDITWLPTSDPANTNIKFQIRTAPDSGGSPGTWTDWLGPDETNGTYYDDPTGGQIDIQTHQHADGSNDQWIQYKAFLESSDGLTTPSLNDVTLQYVVNAPPEYDSGNPAAASQRTSDGKVNITYSARDVDNNTVTPSFEYTLNGDDPSPSWSSITSEFLETADTQSKSVDNVTYTQFTATWDPKSQIDGEYSEQTQIRITLDDGENANNLGTSTTASFTMDVTDPNLGAYPIVVDATTSPADVTLSATDNSPLEYKMSLNTDLSGASWQTYTSSTNITLATDPDTVYVQFRDSVKNTTTIKSVEVPKKPLKFEADDFSNASTSTWRTFSTWTLSDLNPSDFKYYNIYSSTDGISYSLLYAENDITKNYYLHNNLTQNQKYYYKINVEKVDGSLSPYSTIQTVTPTGQGGTDSASPTITNVASSNVTTQSATITWNTEELSDSTVSYSDIPGSFTEASSIPSMVDNNSNYGPHEVNLTGLTPGVIYYYEVKSTDPIGNTTIDNNGGDGYTFTTLAGPQISFVTQSHVSNTKATISWNTNIPAPSGIYYSVNADLSTPTHYSVDTETTEHKLNLMDLTEGTKYYYYVESDTAIDNNAGNYYTFYTTSDSTAPIISDQNVIIITDTKAVTQWSTDEPATTIIKYGIASGQLTETITETSLNYLHLTILSDLLPSTTYYYTVTSADESGNSNTSTESTFQTLASDTDPETLDELNNSILNILGETTETELEETLIEQQAKINELSELIPSPIIQGEPRVDEKSTTATISWTTNKNANSIISYSPEESYGVSTINPYEHEIGNPANYNTEHSITLTNLLPETVYHYQIKTKGIASGQTTSPDYTFTTEKKSFGIENYSIEKITNEKAIFSWVTTEKSNSVLSYTPYRKNELAVDEKSVISDDNLNLIHQVEINTFESGVVYLVELQSIDENENISVVTIETFTTNDENAPPLITQIQTDSALSPGGQAKVQTIISWRTNEPSTSKIYYQQGVGEIDIATAESTQIDTNYTKDHVVIITTFESGSVYQFLVESTDSSGLQSLSTPITILTPQEEQTVFEVIFGAVEDAFGWLRVFNGN